MTTGGQIPIEKHYHSLASSILALDCVATTAGNLLIKCYRRAKQYLDRVLGISMIPK